MNKEAGLHAARPRRVHARAGGGAHARPRTADRDSTLGSVMNEEEVAFETRLAAMDRRLREIQADLVPEREPRPAVQAPRPVPPPAPPPAPRPVGPGVDLLGGLYGRLVRSVRAPR